MHAEGEVTQKIHQVFELWGSGLILHPCEGLEGNPTP